MDNNRIDGAYIERGEIVEINDDGYVVRSFTRYPVLSNTIISLTSDLLEVGDKVYYFMFNDGNGMIVSKIETTE